MWDTNLPLKAAEGFYRFNDGVLLVQELLGGRHFELVNDDFQRHFADTETGRCAADDIGQRPRAFGNAGNDETFSRTESPWEQLTLPRPTFDLRSSRTETCSPLNVTLFLTDENVSPHAGVQVPAAQRDRGSPKHWAVVGTDVGDVRLLTGRQATDTECHNGFEL